MRVTHRIILSLIVLASLAWCEPIARVIKTSGTVRIKKVQNNDFSLLAKPGVAIENGDLLRVESASFAVVMYLDDKSIVKMKENSQFQFVDTENTRTIEVEIGTVINEIKKENRTKTFRVETPTSVASVKGTIFAVLVDASGVDQFFGQEGVFEVFNMVSGETINVGAGQKVLSSSTGNMIAAQAAPSEFPADPDPNLKVEDASELLEDLPEVEPEVIEEAPEPEADQPESQQPEETERLEGEEETPQVPENAEPSGKPFELGAGVGSATIDGTDYKQFSLRPVINFGKLGIGLDLVFYLDNDGNFRKEEWDDASDIVDKIQFIRWGSKGEPFWLRLGTLENVSLGYGGLVNGYSNMMEFPTVRRVGINGGFGFAGFKAELFLANVKDFARGGTLSGIRGSYTISDNFPLEIGANFVIDMNQLAGFIDTDGDNYPDIFDDFPNDQKLVNDTDGDGLSDPVTGLDSSYWDIDADGDNILDSWHGGSDTSVTLKELPLRLAENQVQALGFGFDIGYPIIKSKLVNLTIFTEWSQLSFPREGDPQADFYRPVDRNGTNLTIPGLRATLFKMLHLKLEYRLKSGYYVPGFFDQSYDISRAVPVYGDSTSLFTKDMLVFQDENSDASLSGYFGSAGMDLFNFVSFQASYSSMVRDTLKFNSFNANLGLNTAVIPKLSAASIYYQRNNDENPFDFRNPSINTIIGYRLGYEMAPGVSLIWDFRQFYRDDGTGKLKAVPQTRIETAFKL